MLAHSPRIVTENLVLLLDAANPRNFNLTAVEVLVVAGGGGGGTGGGGGGAGGLIYNSNFAVTPGTQLTATVGDGGAGNSSWGGNGVAGANSVFGSLIAVGGGRGIHRADATSSGTGGSGGGDAGGSGYTLSNATAGQGFSGGNSPKNGDTLEEPGGGGGGAGGVGQNASTPTASDNATVRATSAGAGGPGLGFSISGTFTYYAGGGGGSNRNGVGRSGGLGGGGTGGTSPTAGTPNTGGGGGGTGYSGYGGGGTSGAGGSGIVIVRYPGPQKAIGGTVTSVGGDTIHTFTTSGNFTPLVNTNGSAVLGLSDLSGNRNFGTTFGTTANGPTYSSANGGYIYFDGTDEYATVPSNSGWAFGENGTVEQWVYVAGNSGGNDRFWSVDNNSSSLDAYLNGASYNIGFHGGVVLTTTTISQNTWVHFVVTYTSGTIKVYFNTVEQGLSGTTTGYNITNNGTLYIGNFPAAAVELNGRISSMKIYNRALSAAEVSQNYNALRGRFGL